MTDETRYLTIAQTCDRLDRSRWTIYRLIEAGTLESEKGANGRVGITEDSVAAYERTLLPLAQTTKASA